MILLKPLNKTVSNSKIDSVLIWACLEYRINGQQLSHVDPKQLLTIDSVLNSVLTTISYQHRILIHLTQTQWLRSAAGTYLGPCLKLMQNTASSFFCFSLPTSASLPNIILLWKIKKREKRHFFFSAVSSELVTFFLIFSL